MLFLDRSIQVVSSKIVLVHLSNRENTAHLELEICNI